MTLLPPFFLDALVALEIGPDDDGDYRVAATGFVAGFPTGDESAEGHKLYATFLVTNKHVVEGGQNFVAKVNRGDESTLADVPTTRSTGEPFWTVHDRYDIAVGRVNLEALREEGAAATFLPGEQFATADEMRQRGAATGDDVFVLGFPMGLAGEKKTYGIARSGIIARFDEEILEAEGSYLIDSSVFPGNSGGPVVLRPSLTAIAGMPANNQALIIGVVSGFLPYIDIAISQQTMRPRVTFEENSGLARVVPVDAIRDLVDPMLAAEKRALDVTTKAETGQPDEDVETIASNDDGSASPETSQT